MIRVLFGDDTFRSHEALDELRREAANSDGLGGSIEEVDGATIRPEDLLNAAQTMPLLGGERLIIVRGLLKRFEGRRGGRRKKDDDDKKDNPLGDWERVVDALPSLPESTSLVFVEGKLGAANPMLAAIRKFAEVEKFDLLGKGELAGWIRDRAELYGARLEPRALASMAELVGGDLWTIDSELRKLAAYAEDKPITDDIVRDLVSQVRESNIFALADAIVEGRPDDAIALFQRRIAEGDAALRILSMIARQFRLLIQAKELQAQGAKPNEIAKRLGNLHPYVTQRVLQQGTAYSPDQLRAAYARLLEADLHVKRGIYNEETSLELVIFELANEVASRRAGRRGYSTPPAGRRRHPSAAATGPSGTG